jgi:uncharacterized protein YecE (DUF72 family)
MVDWFLGTIGFTYPEWKGSFYPAGLPGSQSLNYYSRVFNAVEINTTFYGPQPPEQIARWVLATPGNFRFCLKAPRRVTHELRLRDADGEMRMLVDSASGLGEKLGAVLIQLPPSLNASEKPALEMFLKNLPEGPRYALEFRHASWYVPGTADLLRSYNVAWVATDYEDLPVEIFQTSDFLYIRWIGKHNVIPHTGREVIDRTARLSGWIERIKSCQPGIQTIFGFFDNDYAGHSPATCSRFKALAGLAPSASTEEQGRLF